MALLLDIESINKEFYKKINHDDFKEAYKQKEEQFLALSNYQKKEILSSKGEVEELREKTVEVDKDMEELHLLKKSESRRLKALCNEINSKNSVLKKRLREKENLQKKFASLQDEIIEHEKLLDEANMRSETVLSRVGASVEAFRRNFGVQISHSKHDTLILTFTQIDRRNPDKEYLLEISIEDKVYKLHNTFPVISDLPSLQQRLNETNNLIGFLLHLRSLFSKMTC